MVHLRKQREHGQCSPMSDPIRWMGCVVAVYDYTVHMKADRRDESPRAQRGTKRRGRRSGHRNARKSRRLVTADPGSVEPSPHRAGRLKRLSYLDDRRKKWFEKKLELYCKLGMLKKRIRNGDPHFHESHATLRIARERLIRKLVDIKSRQSKDSPEFVRNSIFLILRIKLLGWDSLGYDGSTSGDTIEEQYEEVKTYPVGTIKLRHGNRLCRHCGCFKPCKCDMAASRGSAAGIKDRPVVAKASVKAAPTGRTRPKGKGRGGDYRPRGGPRVQERSMDTGSVPKRD
jgi:hypothetical protein